jgi:hypothetical protein
LNFFINKITPSIFIMWFFCVCLLGCGTMPWQKQAMVTYQSAGEVLEESRTVLKRYCETGVLSDLECAEAKAVYDMAVDIYVLLGNQVLIALDIGDDSVYDQLLVELSLALEQVSAFVNKGANQ